jgi:hypothetical protein
MVHPSSPLPTAVGHRVSVAVIPRIRLPVSDPSSETVVSLANSSTICATANSPMIAGTRGTPLWRYWVPAV